MADIKDLRARLKAIGDAVKNGLPDVATTLTISAKALAERRIKDKGFGAAYSDEKLPAFFFYDDELNGAGKAFIAKNEEQGEFMNWKDLRNAQGLQTGHVDLSYSNKMWANMQPGPVEYNGEVVTAPLAASNTEAQKKMNYNRDRYGDFIGKAITKDDRNALGAVVMEGIKNIIDNENLLKP